MDKFDIKELRASISEYAKPDTRFAIFILTTDIVVYTLAVTGAVLVDNLLLKFACAVIAGLRIGTLFLVSHDAAHDCFTGIRWLNRMIGRLCFLPALHNYSLWLIAHNRLHHQSPNVKGMNSWSPMSKEEFDAMPLYRRYLERFYRSPFGICFYYMVERWWKHKFIPGTGNSRFIECFDLALVVSYLGVFLSILIHLGNVLPDVNPVSAVTFGLLIPLLIAYFLIGVTVYQHHTHETIPWFETTEAARQYSGQEELTMYVRYPRWYNLVSHNSMEHTAHHLDPRIPLYKLGSAQMALQNFMGDRMITIPFTFRGLLKTMKTCKLYDYKNHRWLDFDGKVTSEIPVEEKQPEYRVAA